ncbi:MAG: hypothetical protein GKR99_03785 [Rhodobacteraceae bacterium]|nr:hypothetical protein [Paracoccaceae bacterium]
MDSDYLLVLGFIIVALAFPALINSFSSNGSARLTIALLFIGAALIVAAIAGQPGGYAFADISRAFVRVVAEIIN